MLTTASATGREFQRFIVRGNRKIYNTTVVTGVDSAEYCFI